MIKFQVLVKGMHCRSCELIIEEEVSKIPGVKRVHASTKSKAVEIYSERSLSKNEVAKAISDAGYEVGTEEKVLISKNPQNYKDLLIAGVILVAVILVAKLFGLDKIATSSGSGRASLPVIFVIGLTAGLSTCMALVGGLILGISARHAEKHPEATPMQKFRPHLFFNIGRIASYFFLGGVIGQIGSAFKLSGPTLGFITIFVGIVMFFLGLQLIEIFPKLSSGFTLPKFISNIFRIKSRETKEYSHKNSLILGALTFFLPCGFTQAMQVLAVSTGSFVSGALIMGTFALGTTPGLLGIGGLTSYLKKGYFSRLFFKFVGLLVIALSIFNLSNGLNLTGVKAYFASGAATTGGTNVQEENGTQIVKMDQTTYGYSPNKFTVKVGKPVKWIITSKDSATCASSLIVSKLKIQKSLQEGENIIEFTPKETGKISFSCSMGMYTGYFNVVDDNGNPAQQTSPQTNNDVPTGPQQTPKIIGPKIAPSAPVNPDLQLFKAIYTVQDRVQPNTFNVKRGKPVRIEIEAKEDGVGCMSAIEIPGIINEPQIFEAGQTVVFEFTPDQAGGYQMTCAMGVPFGSINVT
ncbi:MAG: sulfite exporter TauE/SafE family protein [Patescibacteria group bacterium]|nr:sulfite exporter TauE/SafE family protein [Patescibacteria group bacterium]